MRAVMSNLSTSARSDDASIYPRRDLFRLLDRATLALGLPASVYRTAQVLIRFIPADAPTPISPARVQDLADALALDPRTIRAHIRRLAAFDLVSDQTLAGGHRVIRRRADKIVALHGIDFSPMLARRAALEAEAARIEIEQAERIRLRAEISALRRQFRLLIVATTAGSVEVACGVFEALPRRYAHLPLTDLAAIHDRLGDLITTVAPLDNAAEIGAPIGATRLISSDRSEEFSRPNSLRDPDNCVLPLKSVSTTLPRASRVELNRAGEHDSASSATASARTVARGIPAATWDQTGTRLERRQAPFYLACHLMALRGQHAASANTPIPLESPPHA
jgi:hypothetical protein